MSKKETQTITEQNENESPEVVIEQLQAENERLQEELEAKDNLITKLKEQIFSMEKQLKIKSTDDQVKSADQKKWQSDYDNLIKNEKVTAGLVREFLSRANDAGIKIVRSKDEPKK